MSTVQEIYTFLNKMAPFSLQENWDNSGLLVGDPDSPVKKILLALDITDDVIGEAASLHADLIISHHPVIFGAIKKVTNDPSDLTGRKVWRMARNNIAAICCHTNLDSVQGGVNTILAHRLKVLGDEIIESAGTDPYGRPAGIGRIGSLSKPMELEDFVQQVKSSLAPNCIRYVSGGRPVSRVAVGGGSCGSMLEDVLKAGCDTFVTADLKYNHFLDAKEMGLNLIDAGHFPTENPVIAQLETWLSETFLDTEICISKVHFEVYSCK